MTHAATPSIPSLFINDDWLVINKPTGISTHAANAGDLGVGEWLELHHNIKPYICSRLDKGTSGVLIMALNATASGRAQSIHENNSSQKIYCFISDKKYRMDSQWTCDQELDGKPCETEFELIQTGHGYYLYQAKITRGKKHQIRRHAALSGVPILGDDEYGGTEFPRLCLHCTELSWPEIDKTLTANTPKSFSQLINGSDMIMVHTQVAHERRLNWLKDVTSAFRAIHRKEVLNLPFSIDIFENWMCVTGYDENLSSQDLKIQIKPIIDKLTQRYRLKGGVVKTNRRDPHHRKLFSDFITWGETLPQQFLVHEHQTSYHISLNHNQHPGLFIDQRDTRQRLRLIAKNKRVANLFSFTCSFSAVAVQAQAEVAFSIDLAAGTLDRGKQNFSVNELDNLNRGKFIQEDVRKWLARQVKKKDSNPEQFALWDIIICDPPVFASASKGQSFSVSKSWPELTQSIKSILAPDGVAIFANNHRKGNDKFYFDELKSHFSSVIPMKPPLDFPLCKDSPTHVRIFWCQP